MNVTVICDTTNLKLNSMLIQLVLKAISTIIIQIERADPIFSDFKNEIAKKNTCLLALSKYFKYKKI